MFCVFTWCVRAKHRTENRTERKGVAMRGTVFWHTTFINKVREKITKKLEKLCCEAESAWDCCMIPGGRGERWDWRARLCRGCQGATLSGVVKCVISALPSLKPEFVGQRGKTEGRRCANKMSSCAFGGKDPNTSMVPQSLLSQSCGAVLTSSLKETGA